VPDHRIHVYEVETDKLCSYAFPRSYYPVQHVWDREEQRLLAVETRRMDINIELPSSSSSGAPAGTGAGAAAGAAGDSKSSAPPALTKKPPAAAPASSSGAKPEIKTRGDSKDVKGGAAAAAAASASPATGASAAGPDSKDVKSAGGPAAGDEKDGGGGGGAGGGGSGVGTEAKLNAAEVTTLFATSDEGLLMQDSFGIDATRETLIGMDVPVIQFVYRPIEGDEDGDAPDGLPKVRRRIMRDFVGLDGVLTAETKRDLLQFSYQLTIGNMDEAYRAIKKISQVSIWENMAQMCVKTKRLDVAETCLGNMGNARGAKAVRLAKKEPERDAQVAMLAIQLGLLDDAERLYIECARWDLLVDLYMASGRWEDALKICAKYDRIHLKAVHYQYARHLEATGDAAAAIKHYEKSDTHRHEVPRMLFDAQHITDLEQYIKGSDDPHLLKWWAQYCESNGQYDEAIKY
jgi:intraflagellar transport protein 140